MNEILYVVVTIARQIDGEYIFVRAEKAFKTVSLAEELLKKLKTDYTNKEGKPISVNLTTPEGNLPCQCELGILEVKLEK